MIETEKRVYRRAKSHIIKNRNRRKERREKYDKGIEERDAKLEIEKRRGKTLKEGKKKGRWKGQESCKNSKKRN